MHEECGIAGAIDMTGQRSVTEEVALVTEHLQHRGELGAGIAVVQDGVIRYVRNNGLVKDILTPKSLYGLDSSIAVGHTRYATSGSRDPDLAQPSVYESEHPEDSFAFAFNGNIANFYEQAAQIQREGYRLKMNVDTELLRQYVIRDIQEGSRDKYTSALRRMDTSLDGALNMTLMTGEQELFAYRNKNGFRPLMYTEVDDIVAVASEDNALKKAWPHARVHNLEPGQLLRASHRNGLQIQQIQDAVRSHCFFEWVYFANFHSKLDGTSVEKARRTIGERLAEMDGDMMDRIDGVVAVPESALIAAYGYADAAKKPTIGGIDKLVQGRTFIEGDIIKRDEKADEKYGIDTEAIRDKSIVLIDDSIVRGTTMRKLIKRLRNEAGPKEIHLRITCPPLLNPCFYGIDFSTKKELFARTAYDQPLTEDYFSEELLSKLAHQLDVDSIRFVSLHDIASAIGKDKSDLCTACVDAEYPTEAGRRLYNIA